ncbi:MAG: hypothetical protein ABFE08_13605 [Armatimonadia bacterium]
MPTSSDLQILRDLAKQVADIAADPIQEERRNLWTAHNSFERTRPLIMCPWEAAWPEHPDAPNRCEDPFFQTYETQLKQRIFKQSLGDDTVIDSWLIVPAVKIGPPNGLWGVSHTYTTSGVAGGAWKHQPALKQLSDLDKMVVPKHEINEEATAANFARLDEALGDLLTITVDRAPTWSGWHADLSTDLFYLRGLDQLMLDMTDNVSWLHELLSFMRDGILKSHDEAEAAGDWSLINHNAQAQCYCRELPRPAPNVYGAPRHNLWAFFAAQEYALISPRMHDEFLLQYQLPIMEKFGLISYGCCENLTNKVDMLRQVKNLRRFSVTPMADPARCAEEIGTDYILSWRPNPADMICCGFYPDKIRRIVTEAMEAMKGCHVDINLKDVQTVGHQPNLLRDWVKLVRSITDNY